MIALDNGPVDGDYVRYIEGLVAAARTTATVAAPGPAMSAPTFVPMANLATGASKVPETRIAPAAANAIATAMLDHSVTKFPVDTAIPRGLAGVLVGLVLIATGFFSDPVRGVLVLLGILALGAGARTLTRAAGARIVTTS